MKRQSTACILAIGATVTLAACASNGSMPSKSETPSEYQRLVDNASSQLVCRREPVTGSHIYREVCMTLAQREAEHERALELMRDIQRTGAMSQPEPNPPTRAPTAPARTP